MKLFQLYSEGRRVFLTLGEKRERSWIKIAYTLPCTLKKNVVYIFKTGYFIFLSKWGLEEKHIVHWLNVPHHFDITVVLKFVLCILFCSLSFSLHNIIGAVLWVSERMCVCMFPSNVFCILNLLNLARAVHSEFVLTRIENQSEPSRFINKICSLKSGISKKFYFIKTRNWQKKKA